MHTYIFGNASSVAFHAMTRPDLVLCPCPVNATYRHLFELNFNSVGMIEIDLICDGRQTLKLFGNNTHWGVVNTSDELHLSASYELRVTGSDHLRFSVSFMYEAVIDDKGPVKLIEQYTFKGEEKQQEILNVLYTNDNKRLERARSKLRLEGKKWVLSP